MNVLTHLVDLYVCLDGGGEFFFNICVVYFLL